jgi:hypothetical protein
MPTLPFDKTVKMLLVEAMTKMEPAGNVVVPMAIPVEEPYIVEVPESPPVVVDQYGK